jgi:hypothetical protein
VYRTLFPDDELRRDIEWYLVELVDTRTRFAPRRPQPHELRSPALRGTVATVKSILDGCRHNNPGLAPYFVDQG